MKNKFKITLLDRLQIAKKWSRLTNEIIKPMITTDKKKAANKKKCRTKIDET